MVRRKGVTDSASPFNERVVETPLYSLALGCGEDGPERVTAAEVRTGAPRSFVLVAIWRNGSDQMLSMQERKIGQPSRDKRKRKRKKNALKMTLSPSFHISVTIVSPG